jgi:hypothetical protein
MPTVLASPAVLTVAVESVSDDHVAELVRSCVLPSVKVPVAASCCVVPSASDGADGVMARETSAADDTFRVVDPLTEPEFAVMVAVPWPTLVAMPCEGTSLLIVATAGVSELH